MFHEEDEREEELGALLAIFPELNIDPQNPYIATLELQITPNDPLLIRFIPPVPTNETYAEKVSSNAAYIERDVTLSHLPPLIVKLDLPIEYPNFAPPKILLSTQHDWLPKTKLQELTVHIQDLWEEYGRCQILYSYIDYLQQAAENAFDLSNNDHGCLILPTSQEAQLTNYDRRTRQEIFDAGTYDCGVCLDPKKGSSCYRMDGCQHVFCKDCLQSFYNNAIKEGDIAGIRCLDPSCGETIGANGAKKRKPQRNLPARELLAMGIDEDAVRRYVEMKRKKKLEADKSTVYCPRSWCQGPAKSDKYPPIPTDLTTYTADEEPPTSTDLDPSQSTTATTTKDTKIPPDPADRLAVCEKCTFAFCRVCYTGWHGPFARCFPRDPNELSAEEKASYEYIRLHTSPCAYCNAPVQKTMGCNHMCCYQCNTHFCYLCGAWLDAASPYQHFNKQGTPCFMRLWDLAEGDEGVGHGDGIEFNGGRMWEQIAVEVARQADEADAQALAVQIAAADGELEQGMAGLQVQAPQEVVVVVAQPVVLVAPQAAEADVQQRQRVHARHRPDGARNAPRGRAAQNGARRRPVERPPGVVDAAHPGERQHAMFRRFMEMAQRDEEDEWDSDELGDDDEGFVIPDHA